MRVLLSSVTVKKELSRKAKLLIYWSIGHKQLKWVSFSLRDRVRSSAIWRELGKEHCSSASKGVS